MTKTKELLAVLDMPERELDENRGIHQPQYEWLYAHAHEYGFIMNIPHPDCTFAGEKTQMFLADLAFRLRDEVIAKDDKSEIDCYWCEASYEVYLYVIGEENERDAEGLDTWFSMRATPIHWIIAALIAKQKEKEE